MIDKKSRLIYLSIFGVLALISLMDIFMMKSGLFGTPGNYLIGNYTVGLWSLFLKFVVGLILVFTMLYYFHQRDLSESVAVGLGSFVLWKFFGISDILFFWFQGKSLPESLPWLYNHLGMGTIAKLMNLDTVTPLSLYISAIVGTALIYFLVRYLKEKL